MLSSVNLNLSFHFLFLFLLFSMRNSNTRTYHSPNCIPYHISKSQVYDFFTHILFHLGHLRIKQLTQLNTTHMNYPTTKYIQHTSLSCCTYMLFSHTIQIFPSLMISASPPLSVPRVALEQEGKLNLCYQYNDPCVFTCK